MAHNRKSLISVFQQFSASINKAFILAGGLAAGLSFYGVWAISWCSLISWDPTSFFFLVGAGPLGGPWGIGS